MKVDMGLWRCPRGYEAHDDGNPVLFDLGFRVFSFTLDPSIVNSYVMD
jgi:hypothetical protein